MPAPATATPAAGGQRHPTWRWPLLGAVGLVLVVAGGVLDSAGLLEVRAHPWRLLVTLPGYGLLLHAWWRMGPGQRRPLLVLALWSLLLALGPPLHSRDAYSYAAQGWLVSHGLDPYVTASGEAGQAGLLVGVHWFDTTSVYPPLALELFGAISQLFHGDLYWSAVGMRLPNLAAFVVLAWCLPRLADLAGVRRDVVVWAGLLNPVLLVQWIGGAHNDAVMVALLALAFLLAQSRTGRGWWGVVAGGLFLGLAMGVKQSAAVAGFGMVALAWSASAPALRHDQRSWGGLLGRAVAGGVAAVGTFVVVAWATGLGWGWRNDSAGSPLQASSNAPLSWVASFARFHHVLPDEQVTSVLTAVSVLLVLSAIGWLVWRFGPRPPGSVGEPWLLCCGALLAFAVLGPALQPWYLTWVLPFVALAGVEWRRVLFVMTAVCVLVAPLQDVMAPYWAMAALALPVWWAWRSMRRGVGFAETTV